ncbi:FimV/HubP family polar landmark protein [Tahibacter harae]|uniref:FimV/HubP family polar landmark protein n=1 Tax=Tahibacter harae TaxID=2963937 RepID=UPI00272DE098|nr:FimV/HubP family polar landmark protein [Tahibacter harae]
MNGSLKLTLAVALALGSTNALALGLGMIQVKSGLNEPLVAEIPVNGSLDETAGLNVALAAAADFERVGLSRSRIVVPLEFTVATGAKGNAVIKVTTKEPVRDPFLDFLIEVNWAKGKLLREYTVLLDPPTMAPAIKGSRASTTPVKDSSAPASSTQLPASKPGKAPKPARETAAAPAAEPSAPAAPRSAAAGEYGPVAQGETLWEVAAATRPDDSVSLNQVMIALLRSNPNAFFKDNINSLKRGAILRVPSADEIRAAGTAAAAAAEVRSQNDAARGGGAAPTLVADTGSKPAASAPASAAASKPSRTESDRLELVPPKVAKESSASAERPGSGGSGDSSVRAELARTKEALASRDQEAGELKSRVRELEDLKTKNDKLLSLKDSELAALQAKLKELQDKAAKPGAAPAAAAPASSAPATASTAPAASAPAATPPASTTTTVTAPKPGSELTKEEIWGAAAGDKSASPGSTASTPSTAASTPSTTAAPGSSASTAPSTAATAPSSTANTPAASSTTPAGTTPAAASSATPGSSATTGTTTPAAPATTDSPASTTPAASSTAPATPAPAAATPPATTTPAKPATSTTAPAKPATPAKVQPLEVEKPWYSNPNTWIYGAGGLAVLGALGFLLSRVLGKKKAAPAAVDSGYAEATSPLQDEEDALLDRLAQYPDDTSAHLELTSLYYSQGDADKFEAAAQAMYAHIYDTNMPEWQQVQAMGRELVPSNPLFAEPAATAVAPAFGGFGSGPASPEPMRFDGFDDGFGTPPPPAAKPAEEEAFDFDLTDRSAPPAPPPSAARDDFSFDLTPPPPSSNYQTQVQPLPPIPDLAPPPAARVDDDLIAADDAIGTKLDLAKAYLDMGDPDGARSMLEEVLIEGSEGQKSEARKLLAEIR